MFGAGHGDKLRDSTLLGIKNQIINNHENSGVFKQESSYIKKQKWSRDSKKILGETIKGNSRADSANIVMNDNNVKPNALNRSSAMHRSLIIHETSNNMNNLTIKESSKFLPALADASLDKHTISHILQRSSYMALHNNEKSS